MLFDSALHHDMFADDSLVTEAARADRFTAQVRAVVAIAMDGPSGSSRGGEDVVIDTFRDEVRAADEGAA